MKNVLKIFGIIALAAVIGFPLVSCDDGVVSVSVLELTNLGSYNGKYAVAFGIDKSESIQLIAAASVDANNQSVRGTTISGGKAVMTVWIVGGTDENPTFTRYNGNDTVIFSVSISDKQIADDDEDSASGWALATFQKGVGYGAFTDIFPDIDNPGGGGQNSGTSFDITVPSALVGTWNGDASNGTLVFTSSSVSTSSAISSKAYTFITAIKNANNSLLGSIVSINSDGTINSTVAGFASVKLYSWTITGSTLSILDDKNAAAFTGTKTP